LRFRDDAAARDAGLRGGIETHQRRGFHRRIFLVRTVFVPVEIPEQQAFRDGLGRFRRSFAFAR